MSPGRKRRALDLPDSSFRCGGFRGKGSQINGDFLCIASLLSALLLGACATVATGPTFLEAKALPPPAGMATVYVYRKHAEPLAWGTAILFGSHEIATLSQRGFTWVHVPPGAD